MGNCWSGFLAELQKIRRPIDYIERSHQARAARYNVRDRGDGIEFDNLLSEDDFEIETRPRQKVLTDEECTFINQRRYGDLVEKQKRVDEKIDEKLRRHEDRLRLEEEEFYAAKREAARVAKQEKAKKQKTSKTDDKLKQILDDSAFASWLSDEEDGADEDHDLDTQEFEEFLAKVKKTSFTTEATSDDSGNASNNKDLPYESSFEDLLARDVEATKVAEQSLDALERWSPTFDDDND